MAKIRIVYIADPVLAGGPKEAGEESRRSGSIPGSHPPSGRGGRDSG